jgi:tetratricopeptide (TPR) repeat protein
MFPSNRKSLRDTAVAIEARALGFQRVHDWTSAAREWEFLIAIDPGWEHGSALNGLAGCYSELGRFPEAKAFYLRALEVEPDPIYLGNLAADLYLFGDPAEALEMNLQYVQLTTAWDLQKLADETLPVILELADRLGLSHEIAEGRFVAAKEAGRAGKWPEIVANWKFPGPGSVIDDPLPEGELR